MRSQESSISSTLPTLSQLLTESFQQQHTIPMKTKRKPADGRRRNVGTPVGQHLSGTRRRRRNLHSHHASAEEQPSSKENYHFQPPTFHLNYLPHMQKNPHYKFSVLRELALDSEEQVLGAMNPREHYSNQEYRGMHHNHHAKQTHRHNADHRQRGALVHPAMETSKSQQSLRRHRLASSGGISTGSSSGAPKDQHVNDPHKYAKFQYTTLRAHSTMMDCADNNEYMTMLNQNTADRSNDRASTTTTKHAPLSSIPMLRRARSQNAPRPEELNVLLTVKKNVPKRPPVALRERSKSSLGFHPPHDRKKRKKRVLSAYIPHAQATAPSPKRHSPSNHKLNRPSLSGWPRTPLQQLRHNAVSAPSTPPRPQDATTPTSPREVIDEMFEDDSPRDRRWKNTRTGELEEFANKQYWPSSSLY
mmetsp:Transcript_11468/g.43057  ORF Transcript_11468/g.43057 Transcript_11468/m.43057 type:complete len:418 (-) Transcript_11468:118-1371(-)